MIYNDGETIFALSSGMPPAAIAMVRVSGPGAVAALQALTSGQAVPEPRRAVVRRLCDPDNGRLIDEALILRFAAPASATGEDLVELHLHGGRAVVRAVEAVLAARAGLRQARAGEFTRRALANGRIDLAEAEGLADLLAAETETQRRAAMQFASGRFSQVIGAWRDRLLTLSARVEADLDFADEDDVRAEPIAADALDLASEVDALLMRPPAERLRDGVVVVIAGPPNAGKSTLLNAIVERDAAIVSPMAGTTRDLVEVPVAIDGIPYRFIDTAGQRPEAADPVEAVGIARAIGAMREADIILWLGRQGEGPDHDGLIEIEAKADVIAPHKNAGIRLSAVDGHGLTDLLAEIAERAEGLLPAADAVALNARQRAHVEDFSRHLRDAVTVPAPLLVAEELRLARSALDMLIGRTGTEDMLDALFGRFCIGK